MTPENYLLHLRAVYAEFELPFELRPAAGESELSTLMQALGPLEPQLFELWRLTEGSSEDSDQPMFQRPGFIDALEFLTPRQSLLQAQSMQKRAQRMWDQIGPSSQDSRLSGQWWHTGWQPFASFFGDIVLLVDNHPGPEGSKGQVIAFEHDPDEITWIAPSFGQYLKAAAHSIDQDREAFLFGPLSEQSQNF